LEGKKQFPVASPPSPHPNPQKGSTAEVDFDCGRRALAETKTGNLHEMPGMMDMGQLSVCSRPILNVDTGS